MGSSVVASRGMAPDRLRFILAAIDAELTQEQAALKGGVGGGFRLHQGRRPEPHPILSDQGGGMLPFVQHGRRRRRHREQPEPAREPLYPSSISPKESPRNAGVTLESVIQGRQRRTPRLSTPEQMEEHNRQRQQAMRFWGQPSSSALAAASAKPTVVAPAPPPPPPLGGEWLQPAPPRSLGFYEDIDHVHKSIQQHSGVTLPLLERIDSGRGPRIDYAALRAQFWR